MENNFFSGSENLYKYLVSIGLLMVVLTVYYPLKESQDLQVLKIRLHSEFKTIKYEIDQNQKNVDKLELKIKSDKLFGEEKQSLIDQARRATNLIKIKQIKSESGLREIETRNIYMYIYITMVVIFFPTGIFLIWWGFNKWKIAKKNEDEKSQLEKELLEIQVRNANQSNSQNSYP